jgi:hypothetical protein
MNIISVRLAISGLRLIRISILWSCCLEGVGDPNIVGSIPVTDHLACDLGLTQWIFYFQSQSWK